MQEKKKILMLAGFPLFIVVFVVLTVVFWNDLTTIFVSIEALEEFLKENKTTIIPYFVGLQIVQVVLFFIPGEFVQIAGGYLFPFWLALGLTSLGICIGGMINYFFGRVLGYSFFTAILGEKRMDNYIRYFNSNRAWVICTLLFLIPGFPKDILCYIAGIATLRAFPFFLISTIARLPGILGSILMGQAISNRNWWLLVLLGLGSICILFVVHRYRESISRWTSKVSGSE